MPVLARFAAAYPSSSRSKWPPRSPLWNCSITSELSATWRPVIAAISIFAMSDPSLTFGTLHQTGTALPSRIFTRNVAGLFDHLVGELLELRGRRGRAPWQF